MSLNDDLRAELLQLFGQEAESRLQQLAGGLVDLADDGPNPELVDGLFRDAHTLKGSAAVVGLGPVSRVAHAMEDLLADTRRGGAMDAMVLDALLAAVDELQRLMPDILAGEDRSEVLDTLYADLVQSRSTTAGDVPAGEEAGEEPDPVTGGRAMPAIVLTPEAEAARPPTGRPARRDTVWVPVARLDHLAGLVGETAAAHLRLGQLIHDRMGIEPDDITEVHDLGRQINQLQEATTRARMVPIAAVVEPLRRAVRDVARSQGKEIRLELAGKDTEVDRSVLDRLGEALLHLVRNAADHGIEVPEEREARGKRALGTITVRAEQVGSSVVVAVSDDGRGIDIDHIRSRAGAGAELDEREAMDLLFRPGFSTAEEVTDISGRGVGLDAVHAAVAAMRGRVEVRTALGAGAEFLLVLPITLALVKAAVVRAGGLTLAVPLDAVLAVVEGTTPTQLIGGRPTLTHDGRAVEVRDLAELLGPPAADAGAAGSVLILDSAIGRLACRVEEILRPRDLMVRPLSTLLPRLPIYAGAGIQPDGSVLCILDVAGLLQRAELPPPAPVEPVPIAPSRVASVLVVDDAMAVRALEATILRRAGYQVATSRDGLEALASMRDAPPDLVITDLEMPALDGLGLLRAMRADRHLEAVPVIVLTARAADADRRAAIDAGADAYIVKEGFEERDLLGVVAALLGS